MLAAAIFVYLVKDITSFPFSSSISTNLRSFPALDSCLRPKRNISHGTKKIILLHHKKQVSENKKKLLLFTHSFRSTIVFLSRNSCRNFLRFVTRIVSNWKRESFLQVVSKSVKKVKFLFQFSVTTDSYSNY